MLSYVSVTCFSHHLVFCQFYSISVNVHASCTNTFTGSTKPSVPSLAQGGTQEKLGGVCGDFIEIVTAVTAQITAAYVTD